MASLLALLSSGLWGSADYHAGKLSKKFPSIAVLATSQAIGFITGLILVLATGAWSAQAFGSDGYFFAGACAGLCGYAGLMSLYAALSTGRMGVVSPISSLGSLIPLAYAIIIKGDQLSTILSIGVAAALLGGFLASGPEVSQGLPLKPVLLSLSAAVFFGFALVFMAIGSESSALMTMTMMRTTTLIIGIGIFLKFRHMGGLGKPELPILIFIGVADFAANLLLGVATTKGLVSLAMVLGSLYPIATALLAYKFLHERLHKVQYVGIAFAVIGVALISTR
ncbi:EamA-like transporter family protein [Candidatus Planktophila dulcis]|jgi:drug/metabolite transporter (DMT)-like permease|uniref:EamA-like transporter family protein n=1 Tax=Candidatus Planktophila dulcis TaxID=1884914 RepID=A0AAC9YTV6_9ACTN|nr:DMT family transporter [Candidatus Planktophila dulcis]ASY12150.1 EamA-like transporter family protein [Candidatus Planktophila dulcis]